MKRYTLTALVFATVLFAIPALSQPQSATMVLDLRAGQATTLGGSTVPGVSFPIFTKSTNPNCVGWWEAHVDISLKPGSDGNARTAYVTAEYEGTPYGWTIDIGDSSTNNGYGGNSGGPEHAAEVQVAGQMLSVYNDPKIPGEVDNILNRELSLTNGTVKFAIADQTLAVGSPREVLATPVTRTMFAIPDSDASTDSEKWSIHAAFNHVVDPSTDRSGCGVRTVAIWTGEGGA